MADARSRARRASNQPAPVQHEILVAADSIMAADGMVLLWPEGRMPNSRGISVKDSLARHRVWQVSHPRMYAYMATHSEQTGTTVLVIPGGGYIKQAHETAGITVAKWLNGMGINAFVLLHRNPTSPDVVESTTAPTMDAQRAVKWLRANAQSLGIDPHRLGVMGCSAGGHVSACVSAVTDDMARVGDGLDSVSCRPDFTILISPVISMADSIVHRGSKVALLGSERMADAALAERWSMERRVDASCPPALLIHASNDTGVSAMNSVLYYQALLRNGVQRSSLHIFPFGKHSIAVRNQPGSTALWPEIAEAWMREIGMLR
ncbi:MAG: alpha/beta hydrolase [Bacteroidales bacterium]|nr:alpha/beta hydrolase [Bacteroidales bacterium]